MQRFYFLLFFIPNLLAGQMGCPDPMATNYDSFVTINDGSCLYPPTNVSTQILANLPDELPECSGMVAYGNYWIALNDSGGGNDLQILDKATGDFIREIELLNATNVDWEAMYIYEDDLFIADSGNNNGNRQNLGIYKFPLALIEQDEIAVEFYPFSYEDQVDFNPDPEAHPFDCEAMVIDEEGIHLFTKGWDFGKIKHYLFDYESGETILAPVDSFNVNGLVTAASMDDEGTLGFTGVDGDAFLWLFYDYKPREFFSGNKRKIGLGFLGQNESLFFENNETAWITSEDTFQPGKIYSLKYNQWITTGTSDVSKEEFALIFPNPFQNSFEIYAQNLEPFSYKIYNHLGQLLFEKKKSEESRVTALSDAPAGPYWLEVYSGDKKYRQLMIKQ